MAQTLENWIRQEHEEFHDVSDREMNEIWFHRDPTYPIIHDSSLLLAPADGVVLYSGIYGPRDPVEIKGTETSVAEIMESAWLPDTPCLVVGIFMTFYNVHVNRIPGAGVLFYRELDAIKTSNMPMLFTENDLLRDAFGRALHSSIYQKYNARTVNRICLAGRSRDVFVVQIADSEVNVIAPFTARQGWWYGQGERFSMIRGGSQVNLIVPGLSIDELGAEALVPSRMVVRGGEPLVRLTT